MSKIYLNNGATEYVIINAGTPATRTGTATVKSAGTPVTRAGATAVVINAGTPVTRAQSETTTRRAVDAIIAGNIREALTSELTIALTLYGDDVPYCRAATVIEYDGQYYNTISRNKYRDGLMPMCDIAAEHISYKLNDEAYNVSTFAVTGTATELLAAALDGTPFSVGTVEPTGSYTLILNEATTRRALLVTIAEKVGGELSFTGYNVNIVNHIGSVQYIELLNTDNVIDVSENADDREGKHSYTITLGRKTTLALGDNIHLAFTPLEIDVYTRITAIEYNPYNTHEVTIEVGDYEADIVDVYTSLSGTVKEYRQEFTVANGIFESEIESINGDISTLQQTATTFEAVVQRLGDDNNIITAASIVAAINGDESSITLAANKININGVISANGNFQVDTDGNASMTGAVTATSGNIGGAHGWVIASGYIKSQSNKLYLFAEEDGTGTINGTALSNLVIRSGSSATGTFGLTADGKIYCSDVNLSGIINATSGVIGSGATYKWTIGSGTTNAAIYCGLTAIPGVPFGTTSNYAYIGTNGIGLITEAGAMGQNNFNYGTVIRSGSMVTYGDPNGQGLMNRAVQYRPDGLAFWFGGSSRIDSVDSILDLSKVGELTINNGYTADTAVLQLMYAELLYCKRVWADDDGVYSIGTADHKFNDIYAVNSVIQTSDERKKHDIERTPDKYSVFFDALVPVVYKLDSGTSNRVHAGLGAQGVIDALTAAGMTTKDFAGVCISKITHDDGTVTQEYGIRYAEFISLCIKEIQALKKEVAALTHGNNGHKENKK